MKRDNVMIGSRRGRLNESIALCLAYGDIAVLILTLKTRLVRDSIFTACELYNNNQLMTTLAWFDELLAFILRCNGYIFCSAGMTRPK